MATRYGSAEVTLPSDREILITRTFDAPAPLVWEAMTQPEPRQALVGARVVPDGRSARSTCGSAERGATCAARTTAPSSAGTASTARSIRRSIVSTEVFEGFPDAESVNTMTLTEEPAA